MDDPREVFAGKKNNENFVSVNVLPKKMRNCILFIRGFNTDNIDNGDQYSNIYQVLSQKSDIEYLRYSINDDICEVYKNLCNKVMNNCYTHLIGHSMGGGLLMKYIHENKHHVSKYKKIILLMPLVYKTIINSCVSYLPFIRYMYFPKAFLLPASKLYTNGNLLNDNFLFIHLSQVVDMYHKLMLNSEDLVLSLNSNSNIFLFYADGEAFNTIPNNILSKIRNVVNVKGLHECFNSLDTSKLFFDKLLPHLDNLSPT